jgi:hypothetical protein
LGKNPIIRKFQNARLDEWIGDHRNANLIYEEILHSDNKLSYFLEGTIRSREDNFSEKCNQLDFNDIGSTFYKLEGEETDRLYQEEALIPRKNVHESFDLSRLKYSVSVTAKADRHLKLEIRGYNPGEGRPNINAELHAVRWRIKDMDKSKSKKKILRELYLTNREDNLKVYLTIDQWGLVNGSFIIDEKNLGDALVSIHKMLAELSREIW